MQMLVVVTAMVGGLTLATLGYGCISQGTLVFPVVAWLCLFGMNYLIAVVRLSAFVRKAATSIPWGPDSRTCPVCGTR